ncbi:hypothetical protein [Pseudonocardia sp. HH130630-07]|uniref:hypothetical protein n=1 Tax=Pseudonocardia sp. HH130630-07 TaxID=1690815 RepID=UPI0012EA2477|nr:hypothetical protein [Pseudonocardia sp. HH130630-07]
MERSAGSRWYRILLLDELRPWARGLVAGLSVLMTTLVLLPLLPDGWPTWLQAVSCGVLVAVVMAILALLLHRFAPAVRRERDRARS